MDLGKKIQQVLKHYPSVYVDGLGVFKKVHQASTFDEQHNVFLPPIDYVEFDDRAQEGLDLAEYLRQENEISRTDANELVGREVAAIISDITEHGKAHIPQLGDLLTLGDGYVFRPIDLSSFVFEPISNIDPPVQKTEVPDQHVAVPAIPEEEPPAEVSDSEEVADENLEEHHIDEEVAPISHEEIVTKSEEELDDQKATTIEPSSADEVWKSHVDAPESLKSDVNEAEISNIAVDQEAEASVESEINSVDRSHAVTVPEAPPLIQNKYQGERSGVEQEDIIPPALIPSNENQEYTYAKEYVEDTNRSHIIWYVLAAIVALSIIGALWYVTRPASLYSDVSAVDSQEEMKSPYATEEEYNVPDAAANMVDTSSVLRERPDTANRTSQTPATPPSGAAIQPIIPANHHWYIVIGSRLPLQDAEEMVADYNKKGQPHVRLIPGRGADSPATVIWDSYVSKEKADSALRLVRKDFVADAWHKSIKK